ncbi:MAG: transglycosylase SLT domain-containing protein [Pseudomonadota bacterium]
MPRTRRSQRCAAWAALVVVAATGALPTNAVADAAPPGRAIFERAWPEALDGRWPLSADDERTLKTYPLATDLRAAWYSARLDQTTPEALEQFMSAHDGLPPIRRLRYRYAIHLATTTQSAAYRRLYAQHYAAAGVAALDCLELKALLAEQGSQRDRTTIALAEKLWRVPSSQHRYCDASFDVLLNDGTLGAGARRDRLELAIEARNFSLAAYVADLIGPGPQGAVARWRRMQRDPAGVLGAGAKNYSAEQIDYGLRRLALRDPLRAGELWQQLRPNAGLDSDGAAALERHIALATAQDYHVEARELLANLPDSVADTRALEWRARAAMRVGDWADVVRTVARMSAEDQASERWRYWEAVALIEIGQVDAGRGLLEPLAQERSYHGFLAADRLGQAYSLQPQTLDVSADAIATIGALFEVQRAVELDAVNQRARAQREWQRAVRNMSVADYPAAAAFAHERGWHAAAIRQLADLEAWDDLDRRYPLAHAAEIAAGAQGAGIETSWALAIARSESLFDPDARSGAGAIGLMQLLPGTAKRVAKRTSRRWRGQQSLREPAENIALGTHYLGELAQDFDHPALATAAYNAGPERIPGWLPSEAPMPADLWIETIAYDETRAYVQRVLAAEVIYRDRLGLATVRLSERLPPVAPESNPRVAKRL